MGETHRIRSRAARALGVTMVLASLVGLASAAAGGADALVRVGAPVALFGVLGWAAFWQPYVGVSDGGVTLANTLRTVEVPWPAVEEVDGRYGLRLLTAYGEFTGWAAPAPAGRQRARGEESSAARAVAQHLADLRAAGHLADRRLETPSARITWHVPLIAVVATLGLATVLLPLLG